MFGDPDMRAIKEAEFIISKGATVRSAAKEFGISKSTVHYDVTKRLRSLDGDLYEKVGRTLYVNLCERHVRGGLATREKFANKNR